MKNEMKICSICDNIYTGFGNNAWPFKGRCCDWCNGYEVIPARLVRLKKYINAKKKKKAAA
jgi:hypothetical protein